MTDEDQQKKELKERVKAEKREQDLYEEAVTALLTSAPGRAYLRRLFEMTGLDRVPFTGNALTGAFATGEFNVGMKIKADLIEIDPDGYLTFLKDTKNV